MIVDTSVKARSKGAAHALRATGNKHFHQGVSLDMRYLRALAVSLVAMPLSVAAEAPRTIALKLHGNVAFVKASIGNSAPLDMALDTGTIRTTLDEAVAVKLGLDLSLKATSSGMRGTQQISVIKDQTLKFCGLEMAEPMMIAYPLDFVSKRLGRRLDGIIGVELLHQYVVEIDYPARQVRVFPPDAFVYGGSGESLPVTYDRRLPIVAGAVTPFGRNPIPARFQVDTGGASAHVMLWKGFVEKYDLAAGARDIREVQVTAFTGTTTQKQGIVQALQIGKIAIREPEVGLNDYQFGDPKVFDGNLGSGFLRQFKVIFDLPHDRMILEQGKP